MVLGLRVDLLLVTVLYESLYITAVPEGLPTLQVPNCLLCPYGGKFHSSEETHVMSLISR